MTKDRLQQMFELRLAFMQALSEDDGEVFLDLGKKENQRLLRDISLRGVEEVFEALQHLKNWKPHRKTEIKEFDRDKFLEEWVDAFNYFLSTLIKAGYTSDDLYEAYVEKDKIIHERIKSNY